jgi:hypothetical protein
MKLHLTNKTRVKQKLELMRYDKYVTGWHLLVGHPMYQTFLDEQQNNLLSGVPRIPIKGYPPAGLLLVRETHFAVSTLAYIGILLDLGTFGTAVPVSVSPLVVVEFELFEVDE